MIAAEWNGPKMVVGKPSFPAWWPQGAGGYLYLNLRSSLRAPGHAQGLRGHLAPRKHRYLPHRSRWALEMAARARSEPQGRSKWLLEPARSRSGARNGCSSPPRSHRGARNGCSSPPGAAAALEMAARARLGAARALQLPARASLGAAGAFTNYVRNDCSEKLPLFGCSLNHFALLNFASCMDMHGFALVYIYLYIYIYL